MSDFAVGGERKERVLITGGNRGIGLALAEQLSARGARVLVACRAASAELSALTKFPERQVEVIEGLDVRRPEALSSALSDLGVKRLDLLINNAGILRRDQLGKLSYDQLEEQLAVNTLGPLRVVEACLPFLDRGSKIANVSSRMGSIEDNSSGGMYGYRLSKAALNMASVSLAQDLKTRGVAVIVLHPGYVRTGMTGHNGLIDTEESARGLIERIDSLTLETTGTFWHTNGDQLPW